MGMQDAAGYFEGKGFARDETESTQDFLGRMGSVLTTSGLDHSTLGEAFEDLLQGHRSSTALRAVGGHLGRINQLAGCLDEGAEQVVADDLVAPEGAEGTELAATDDTEASEIERARNRVYKSILGGEWERNAACMGTDADSFFVEGKPQHQITPFCKNTCPVIAECTVRVLKADKEWRGVWGGMTERERRKYRKNPGLREHVVAGALDFIIARKD